MDFFRELLSNTAVIWFLVGLVLMLLELAIPGFVLIFFGAGAWITAIAYYLFEPDLNTQLAIFILSSVLMLVLLRKQLKSKLFKEKTKNEDFLNEEFIGKTAEVTEDIQPNKSGKINFNGTVWTAKSDVEIKKGNMVEITGKESIVLFVKPK